MSYASVLSALGWGLAIFAATMLVPVLIALGYGETEQAASFAFSAVLTAFAGGGFIIATRGSRREVSSREGLLLAVLFWTVLPLFGGLPFLFNDAFGSVTDSYFEALSGLTTTGATVLTDLDQVERSVLLWRASLAWLGGLATILLAISLLSLQGIGGMELYRSALPKGEKEALQQRLIEPARSIWWVYAGLTLVCAIVLWISGMPAFDAVAYALSTLSSGGFTTFDGAAAMSNKPLLEFVLIVFMIAAAVNFTLHWALAHGRPREYAADPELRHLLALVIVATAAASAVLYWQAGYDIGESVRIGLFGVVSMLTTTGFMSGEGANWPVFLPVLLLALSLVGGSTGSTAGGIKLMRFLLFLKQGRRELARLAHPHGIARLHYGHVTVPDSALRSAWSFFIMFMCCFVLLAVALAALGLDMRAALAATVAGLSNNGPAFAVGLAEGGGYAALPNGAKWVFCLAMLLGRLEILAVLIVFSAALWRR